MAMHLMSRRVGLRFQHARMPAVRLPAAANALPFGRIDALHFAVRIGSGAPGRQRTNLLAQSPPPGAMTSREPLRPIGDTSPAASICSISRAARL